MTVVILSSIPKGIRLFPVATVEGSLLAVAGKYSGRLESHTIKESGLPRQRYKQLCMRLTSGTYATLTQQEGRSARIEIGLQTFKFDENACEIIDELDVDELRETFDDDVFYERDVTEIVAEFGLNPSELRRVFGVFCVRPRT